MVANAAGAIAALVSAMAVLPQTARAEIHLISEGYHGPVRIIFRVQSADPLPLENDALVYHVPRSGMLITSSDENQFPAWKFYFEGPDGARTPITRIRVNPADARTAAENDEVGIFSLLGGNLQLGPPGGCRVMYVEYFVGTRHEAMNRDTTQERRAFQEFASSRNLCAS